MNIDSKSPLRAEDEFRSGMVALLGPPNAGKSTLMNYLLGQKISIVTPKPQTTRNRILGVLSEEKYQIVLLDTPGLHDSEQILNREMVRIAMESLSDIEAVLFLMDAEQLIRKKRVHIEAQVKYLEQNSAPAFLLLNKIDLVKADELLPLIEMCSEVFDFKAIIPVSARSGKNVGHLVDEIVSVLPVGPKYFPDDIPTDASVRFLASEIIREKVFLLTGQEIPYSTAVVIDAFDESVAKTVIHASIVVEKDSQKGIIIGKGGAKLKSIGVASRRDIEKLIGEKIVLKLWVKVKKNWTENARFIDELMR